MRHWLRSPIFRAVLFLLALVAVAAAWRALPVAQWVEGTIKPVQRAGIWGYAIFILAYTLATIFMFPGSPLTMACGFLYGPLVGTILVSAGSTLGAAAAFLVARWLGRERVRKSLGQDAKLAAIDSAVAQRGAWVVFLLRLSPLVPFNVVNYALGLTGVRFWPYVLASWLGMLPGTALYVMIGAWFGPRGRPGGLGTAAWVATIAGTLLVTIYLGWLARRALSRADATLAR